MLVSRCGEHFLPSRARAARGGVELSVDAAPVLWPAGSSRRTRGGGRRGLATGPRPRVAVKVVTGRRASRHRLSGSVPQGDRHARPGRPCARLRVGVRSACYVTRRRVQTDGGHSAGSMIGNSNARSSTPRGPIGLRELVHPSTSCRRTGHTRLTSRSASRARQPAPPGPFIWHERSSSSTRPFVLIRQAPPHRRCRAPAEPGGRPS